MARQTIAVDIDDVLAASADAWVKYSNQKWGTNLTVEDYHEDWAKMWQVDRATEVERAQHVYADGLFKDVPHDESAKEVLQHLSLRYDLVIASSRVYKIHQDTLAWLDRHFGGIFKEVHLAGIYDHVAAGQQADDSTFKQTKAALIAEIGADYLIDDQPKHCLAVAAAGIEAILFGDYRWTREVKQLPPRVARCHSWHDVKEYFDARS